MPCDPFLYIGAQLAKKNKAKRQTGKGRIGIKKRIPRAYEGLSLPQLVELSGSGVKGSEIRRFFKNPFKYIREKIEERQYDNLPIETQLLLQDAADAPAAAEPEDPLAMLLGDDVAGDDTGDIDIMADLDLPVDIPPTPMPKPKPSRKPAGSSPPRSRPRRGHP